MNTRTLSAVSTLLLAATAAAQTQGTLLSFSQTESSASGSGGTVLETLYPNEIHSIEYVGPCTAVSTEKWSPRTCIHTMAGDENGDGQFYRPNVFGNIDALLAVIDPVNPFAPATQRSVYWSPSAQLGPNVSLPPFRPGDVARLNTLGQTEYFITQTQINIALGLPPATPIDVDAVAYQPGFGIFLSLDDDVFATTACGPMLVEDGAVICIPPGSFTTGIGFAVTATVPNSAVVIYDENDMDAFVVSADATDRFGACLTQIGDLEALDIDLSLPTTAITPCVGITVDVPNLLFTSENGTGGSIFETDAGGQIRNSTCGPIGRSCGTGPTLGFQIGIQPLSGNIGAPSYVDALTAARVCRFVFEPQDHVITEPLGAPLGFYQVDYHNPFGGFAFSLIEFVLPPLAPAFPTGPFSPNCFPDLYTPSLFFWQPLGPGFGSFPVMGIPPAWSGKVLFQGLAFANTFELSTPAILDIN